MVKKIERVAVAHLSDVVQKPEENEAWKMEK